MPRRNPVLVTAACCAVTLATTTATLADPSPEDAKDYRQAVMTSLGGHVSAISMHVRGLVDYEGSLATHADALASTAAEVDHIFPEGSNVGDSEALPAIWEDTEAFSQAVAALKEATTAFAEVADSGDTDAIRSAFREVGGACRGCHDDFRKEHEH